MSTTEVDDTIRKNLMDELQRIENTSDLQNLTILARNGMKIATAKTYQPDMDPTAASSAALIDVGLNFVQNLHHGNLKEILIRGKGGYAILMHVDTNYLTFAGLSNLARIGYYLELLRIRCKKFSFILAGGKVTEELKADLEAEKARKEKLETETIEQMFESDASTDKDMEAMKDVLSFLDEWEGDEVPEPTAQKDTGIVSISEEYMIGQDIEPEKPEPVAASQSAYQLQVEDKEFPIYEGEVPPVPLEDVEALEIGAAAAQPSAPEPSTPVPDGPNFNQFAADEYSDFEEDETMMDVLDELGYTDKKKRKK
ncbi:MAG: roadblock/LC7 domain-containing protein [Promethearchaeota archaeon]